MTRDNDITSNTAVVAGLEGGGQRCRTKDTGNDEGDARTGPERRRRRLLGCSYVFFSFILYLNI